MFVQRNEDLVGASVGSDSVLMSLAQGDYFGLNGVGSRVWAMLERPISVDEIASHVCAEYAVDEATCRADVERFVKELSELGLVRYV